MNHLYINNCSVDSLGDLKSLMDKFRVAKDDDPLFIDLIDNFVDGNIEVFLRTIGENELAERIKNIDTANGDSQIKQELIKDVCDVKIILQLIHSCSSRSRKLLLRTTRLCLRSKL